MNSSRRIISRITIILLTVFAYRASYAANWFMLQGVSPKGAPPAYLAGYLTPSYLYENGSKAANGEVPHLNTIAPDFTSSNTFNIRQARPQIRGRVNNDISYFFSAAFGNNGFNHVRGDYRPGLIDAHGTFSHYIPGMRIEAGIIRAPEGDQAMQGYMAYQFASTNFATVTTQLELQNFYDNNQVNPYQKLPTTGYAVPGSDILGNNGFRYTGVEAMDWFRRGPWEFTYAAMLGNFGPLTSTNQSNRPLFSGRLQESYVFGGKGPFRSDLTGYVWYQHANPSFNGSNYRFTREGTGITYLQGYMQPWGRWVKAEYISGSGLINSPSVFSPSEVPSSQVAAQAQTQVYPGSENTAHGYYVGAGLFLTNRLEADVRYDYYDRLPNLAAQEREFKTYAFGLQYQFTPLIRVLADVFIRNVDIPNPGAIATSQRSFAQSVVNSADNELAIQAVIGF